MSNDSSTALAVIDGQQQQFNPRQLAIITNQIAKGANEDELAYFLEVCKSTGLNPLQKQIYAIMRGPRDNKRMTIQTGIDGYRLIAARTGQLAGIDDPTYDSEDAKHPNKASVTVWRFVAGHRVPFVATARWAEYKPEPPADQMWQKMPYLMLGKCAEALALRKAFPAELSGVYTGEEMAQADNDGPQGYIEAVPGVQQPQQPRQQQTAPAAPAFSREARIALRDRWYALQPDEPGMRTQERFNARMRQMFGHGAPFSDAECQTMSDHIEREEGRRRASATSTSGARVVDAATGEILTAEAEGEPIPFDLRTLPVDGIGA